MLAVLARELAIPAVPPVVPRRTVYWQAGPVARWITSGSNVSYGPWRPLGPTDVVGILGLVVPFVTL